MASMTPSAFLESLRRGSGITFGASALAAVQPEIGSCLARALDPALGATEEVRYAIELARPARDWMSGSLSWCLALSRHVLKITAAIRPGGAAKATLDVDVEIYPTRTLTGADIKTRHQDSGTGSQNVVGVVLTLGFTRGMIEISSSPELAPGLLIEFMNAVLKGDRP
jgi:hypothetical protein